mgnify:FL=1
MTELPYSDGVYRTSPRTVPWYARWFPSLVFHLRFIWIVLRSARQAKQGKYGDNEWVSSSLEIVEALEKVGVQFEITGIDFLRQAPTPCLVIGNHLSTLETMVLPGIVQPVKQVTFVVKQSLLTYPLFGHVMRSRDPIPVTQTDPRADLKSMLDGGQQRLVRGISIIIFPEGERATAFDPVRFNSIGAKLASRAGVPIVPVALETTAWGRGKLLGDFGRIDPRRKVRFAFAPAIAVEGRGTTEQERTMEFIQSKLGEWRVEDDE